MTNLTSEFLDPEEEQDIALEPLPAFMKIGDYFKCVAGSPIPTAGQFDDFVRFAVGAKSWYKHLPSRPPGSPMHFSLDPNAGRDRLRRWGDRVIYRDRTMETEQFHNSWMTTEEYRRRFGYLAYCCPQGTRLFMTVKIADGIATLDPNVFAPYVESEFGLLALAAEEVLSIGRCAITRTVHERTNAELVWKKWGLSGDEPDESSGPRSPQWMIGQLCEELQHLRRKEPIRRVTALERELNGLVEKQREQERGDMKAVIENMLEFVERSLQTNTN